ncbi:carboxylesterase family protein [Streptomyces venezuelae ATCC 10712]
MTAFLGIPYAAPPFGALRFRAPAPPEPWTGVRAATAHGPTAPHAPYAPPFDALIPDEVVPGEECLNLGVWTPAPEPGAGLPVMVWVHGGAFTNGSGSASAYDGSAFARDGVVCVTFNYRLGADGFLRLPGRPDNRGLLDQIAALRWVRDNIASFGGDPGRVTVFGESAGAMSIGALLTAGAARGLFHRAILQSGACHHFLRPRSAELVAARLAEKLGIEPTPEAFDGVPLGELLAAQAQLRAEVGADPDPARWGEAALNMMPFEPVLEDLALPGPDSGVDLLIGSNREEYRLFLVPTERLAVFPESSLRALTAAYGLDPAGALAVYRAARPDATPANCSTPWPRTGSTGSPPSAWPSPYPARTCTSSPGARPGSAARSAPATPSNSPSSSTASTTRRTPRCSGPTRRRPSRTPCTGPGCPSRRRAVPAGRRTTGRTAPR